jgi:hypothetical protein
MSTKEMVLNACKVFSSNKRVQVLTTHYTRVAVAKKKQEVDKQAVDWSKKKITPSSLKDS